VCTVFAPHSPSYNISPPPLPSHGHQPPSPPALFHPSVLWCCRRIKKDEKKRRKWQLCLFKVKVHREFPWDISMFIPTFDVWSERHVCPWAKLWQARVLRMRVEYPSLWVLCTVRGRELSVHRHVLVCTGVAWQLAGQVTDLTALLAPLCWEASQSLMTWTHS
jgi:hypothetical protein